jgi:YHS domain-containing protein
MNLLGVTLLGVFVVAWGCSRGSHLADSDTPAHVASKEVKARLAQLSDEDRKLAEAQVFCVVNTSNELGCMGVPYKVTIEGRTVFLCCEHCKDAALENPQATLATLDGLLQKNSASLPKNTK